MVVLEGRRGRTDPLSTVWIFGGSAARTGESDCVRRQNRGLVWCCVMRRGDDGVGHIMEVWSALGCADMVRRGVENGDSA